MRLQVRGGLATYLPEIISRGRNSQKKSLRLNQVRRFTIGDLTLVVKLGPKYYALIYVQSPSKKGLRIFNFLKTHDSFWSPADRWFPFEISALEPTVGEPLYPSSFLLITKTDGKPQATIEVVPGVDNKIANCSLEIRKYSDAEFSTRFWQET